MPPKIRVLFHEDILIQAAREWEAADFRPDRLPSLEDISSRNLLWREQVVSIHNYLEWARKAAEHPEVFGSIEDALKET